MDVSTIIQKLEQSKIPNVTPGTAKNLDEFFEMIIRPQFEKTTVINCIHHEILEYIKLKRPDLFCQSTWLLPTGQIRISSTWLSYPVPKWY